MLEGFILDYANGITSQGSCHRAVEPQGDEDMNASDWSYSVPYQKAVNRAMQELKQQKLKSVIITFMVT